MIRGNKIKICFYGDDFTGSTDALEALSLAGANTQLFIQPPGAEILNSCPDLDAFGIAGLTRSMAPAEMNRELTGVFNKFKKLDVQHIHYKVCSTFDSSPETGSIGQVIETAFNTLDPEFIPVIPGAPALGRYCAFGNLFASFGKDGEIFRLDRHPSISHHPVTPMKESDLLKHLSLQSKRKTGLINYLSLDRSVGFILEDIQELVGTGTEVIFFDTLNEAHLLKIGEVLELLAYKYGRLFTIGSSGVEAALGSYWNKNGVLNTGINWPGLKANDVIMVASGSCSPVTKGQIEWAMDNGFEAVRLDTLALIKGDEHNHIVDDIVEQCIKHIAANKSPVVFTGLGNDDPLIKETRKAFHEKGIDQNRIDSESSKLFGATLGKIAREVFKNTRINRLLIAGGDTSGYLAGELGIGSLQMITSLVPGAPLCITNIPDLKNREIEINFKGGQVGGKDYFGKVRTG